MTDYKLYVGEIDPIYEIEGIKYATYGHSTTGLKEETTGKVKLQINTDQKGINTNHEYYMAVIDFDKEKKGSDLWLFRQITAFGKNWQDLVVSLTPEARAEVWYELNEKENTLTIFGTKPVAVSYRLIAPRFDWPERNTNLASSQELSGIKVK